MISTNTIDVRHQQTANNLGLYSCMSSSGDKSKEAASPFKKEKGQEIEQIKSHT